jgi:hypothetical protein
LWLREGLVETWSDESKAAGHSRGLTLDEVERGLERAVSQVQSQAAHRAAGEFAAELLDRYGRAQVLEWLRSGVPDAVIAGLK